VLYQSPLLSPFREPAFCKAATQAQIENMRAVYASLRRSIWFDTTCVELDECRAQSQGSETELDRIAAKRDDLSQIDQAKGARFAENGRAPLQSRSIVVRCSDGG